MKRTFAAVAAVLFAIAVCAGGCAKADCYSDGVRVGVIQKLSRKGFVAKSWEGELVMQGERLRGNQYGVRGGNVWSFSITNPAVAKQVDEAMTSGRPVALKYCQEAFLTLTTDTPYRIVSVTLQ